MAAAGKVSDHLANERTFLAWIRTSIAVISLGFVVAKFSVWLRELAARLDPRTLAPPTGASLPLGIAMMVFGSVLALLALAHHRSVRRAIERGDELGSDRLVIGVAIVVALLGGTMIAYMLSAAQHT